MLAWLISLVQKTALVAILTVGLISTGFGHQMPVKANTALDAYVQAGGDASAICGEMDTSGKGTQKDCPACHILAGLMLPDALLSLVDADLIFVATVIAPRESRALLPVLDPGHGMRAPPLA